MPRKACDFSGARPTAKQLVAAGIEGVLFYVGPPGDWRMPPRWLIDSYIAAGIECAAIYEEGRGDFALFGYQRGLQVGQNARRFLDGYGWGGAAYVATDIDITPAQIPVAVDAYKGVRDGMGAHEAGIYGGGLIVEAVRTGLGYRLLWRANASSWHHGAPANGLTVQQHLGPAAGVPDSDADTIYVDKGGYWGQWSPGFTAPTGSTQQEDDDMTPQEFASWLTGVPVDKVQPNDVLQAIATKSREEVNGWLDTQREQAGQPKGNGPTLAPIHHELTSHDEGTIKTNSDRIYNAVGATP